MLADPSKSKLEALVNYIDVKLDEHEADDEDDVLLLGDDVNYGVENVVYFRFYDELGLKWLTAK